MVESVRVQRAIVAFSRIAPMIGIFSDNRSIANRKVCERRRRTKNAAMVPIIIIAISHQDDTKKSDMAITMSVGSGRLAPKLVNTCLKAGMTHTMITQMTTIATMITEIG